MRFCRLTTGGYGHYARLRATCYRIMLLVVVFRCTFVSSLAELVNWVRVLAIAA